MKKLFLLLIIFFSNICHAYRLSPMVQNFSPEGKDATKTFLITNDGKESISLEVVATTRSIAVDGKEERNESEHFMVYPPQLTVKAGERRSLRVSYVGPKEMQQEVPYRLVVRQLPVNVDKKKDKKTGAQIDFMFEYIASLYVSKDGVKANVSLDKVEESDKQLQLTFSNSGSKHGLLKDFDFLLGDSALSEDIIKPLLGINVLPGGKRSVLISRPKNFSKNSQIRLKKK
jgi:fimbrial chaperone protein